MSRIKILIVGAGPGGLASAMLLAHRGFEVHVFEKSATPGGRTSQLQLGDYKFDVGPTFFMMKHVLDEIFQQCGKKSEDYLAFTRLSPMYRLILPDNRTLDAYEERDKMYEELRRVFPGEEKGLARFYTREKKRYDRLMPILRHHNNDLSDIFSLRFFKAFTSISLGRSLFEEMGKYFSAELARLSFTFQSKYLGMSPWECPGAFGLVPYIEHSEGVYHIQGGLSQITTQMARAAQEEGAIIHYSTPVRRIITHQDRAAGVETEKGETIFGNEVIVNADFGYAAKHLFEAGALSKYSPGKLTKKKISCSIFMMYLGIKTQYKLPHNTIVFAPNYKKNVEDVFSGKLSGDNISLYVRDTSTTDPTLAPAGKTALYVLVPVPNNRSGIDWNREKQFMRAETLNALKTRLRLNDIEEQIEEEKIITPADWEVSYNVYEGAVFNLAHNLGQMLWFRPHNKFEELENCYLTGGGTHPGSGLPTIFESGRISANLITEKYSK